MKTTNADVQLLLRLLEEAFEKRTWHGPNLRGSIRGLRAEQAVWRPSPERHNIWEIVVHVAYWKYIARRRIVGEKRGSFPLRGSNWIRRPVEPSENAWREDQQLLATYHRLLYEVVAELRPADLIKIPRGSKVSNLSVITGIANHDIYHAGQIQLLKRLMNNSHHPQ